MKSHFLCSTCYATACGREGRCVDGCTCTVRMHAVMLHLQWMSCSCVLCACELCLCCLFVKYLSCFYDGDNVIRWFKLSIVVRQMTHTPKTNENSTSQICITTEVGARYLESDYIADFWSVCQRPQMCWQPNVDITVQLYDFILIVIRILIIGL